MHMHTLLTFLLKATCTNQTLLNTSKEVSLTTIQHQEVLRFNSAIAGHATTPALSTPARTSLSHTTIRNQEIPIYSRKCLQSTSKQIPCPPLTSSNVSSRMYTGTGYNATFFNVWTDTVVSVHKSLPVQ